jgi:hypothetical protein
MTRRTTDRSAIEQIEWMRNLLSFSLVGSFIWCIPLFAFKAIPTDNKDIIVYMVGQLSGMALTALGFYFVNKVGQDALDAKRTENTTKALEAIKATAQATGTSEAAADAAEQTAEAAVDKAAEIKGAG